MIYKTLEMGPIVCTEMAVRDYHYALRNNPGQPRSQLDVLVYRSFANCIRHPTENCRMITNADSRRMWPESVVGCLSYNRNIAGRLRQNAGSVCEIMNHCLPNMKQGYQYQQRDLQ